MRVRNNPSGGVSTIYADRKEKRKADKYYSISAMVKTEDVTSGGGRIKLELYDSSGTLIAQVNGNKTVTGDNDYERNYAVLKPTDYPDATSIRVVLVATNTNGYVYFDGIRFEERSVVANYGYNSSGNYLTSISDPIGNKVTFEVDDYQGNINKIVMPKAGAFTEFGYDGLNRLQTSYDESGLQTEVMERNEFGQPTTSNYNKMVNGAKTLLSTESIQYNSVGDVSQTTEYTDVSNLNDPSLQRTKKIWYDLNGNIEDVIDPTGNHISFAYDNLNQLKTIAQNNLIKWTFGYDVVGNLTKVTDEKNQVTSYGIDPDSNEVTRVTYPSVNGVTISSDFGYNPSGLMTSVKHSLLPKAIIYDTYDSGLSKGTIGAYGQSSTIMYNETQSVYKTITNDGKQEYHTYYDYNDNNQIERRYVQKKNELILEDESFQYDEHGNVKKITYKDGSYIIYEYDLSDRLKCANYHYLNEAVSTECFSYNELGNRLTYTKDGITTSYSYNDVNEIETINGQDKYDHDKNGNMIQNKEKDYIFAYNAENKLEKITKSNGTEVASYQYNHEGLRSSKTVNGVTQHYYYVGGHLAFITDSSAKLIYSFTRDASGKLLTMTDHTGTTPVNYFYVTNVNGDITGLMDSSGTKVVSYRYDAYGNIVKSSGTKTLGNGKLLKDENPFRYASYFYDNESGLYYLNSRYYDSKLGRFITKDVIPATNLYEYGFNNPIRFIDPSGYRNIEGAYSAQHPDPVNTAVRDTTIKTGQETGSQIVGNQIEKIKTKSEYPQTHYGKDVLTGSDVPLYNTAAKHSINKVVAKTILKSTLNYAAPVAIDYLLYKINLEDEFVFRESLTDAVLSGIGITAIGFTLGPWTAGGAALVWAGYSAVYDKSLGKLVWSQEW